MPRAIRGLAFAGFVLLITTGVLMRYVLPPGSGRRAAIWGLDRHGWGDLHFWFCLPSGQKQVEIGIRIFGRAEC